MVELDHPFSTGKPIDENWRTILDLERPIPLRGGRLGARDDRPGIGQGRDQGEDGAMSMTFKGTVEVAERDEAARTALLKVKSREAGGQGFANADVAFFAVGRRRHDPHRGADHGQSGIDGRGGRRQRARRADQGLHRQAGRARVEGRSSRSPRGSSAAANRGCSTTASPTATRGTRGRARFATAERFPAAERVLVAWPQDAFAELAPIDRLTAIAVLTHDPKLDDAALQAALASKAGYIGAMGSRRAQAIRRERLIEAG